MLKFIIAFSLIFTNLTAKLNTQKLTIVSKEQYREIIYDNEIDKEEELILYTDYYTQSPETFMASATWYGSDEMSYQEVYYYGEALRQQMERGFVLIGSEKYGYNFEPDFEEFISKNYPYMDCKDFLLSKQSSPLYYYYADGGLLRKNRDSRNQPIEVLYKDLNQNQKRIYDITKGRVSDHIDTKQYLLTPEQALASGKYTSIVSTKSPNDIGKVYLIYRKYNKAISFYGVVLVGGVAKRDDWTGLGRPTTETFRWYNYPLITRETDGQHWGFDFPTTIYKWFGGSGGPVTNIIAMSPENYLTSEQLYDIIGFR